MTDVPPTAALTGPLYRVVEIVDGPAGPTLEGRMVAAADQGKIYARNAKKRLYDGLPQARMYKKRLQGEGRDACILRFVCEGEVD